MSEASWQPGRVQWRELMTADAERARAFYGGLFGWTFRTEDLGDGFLYSLIDHGGLEIGGLYATPPGAPPLSRWASYVSVADVDDAVATALENGGRIARSPFDQPGVGRMAAIADPDGAVIWLFRSAKGDPAPRPPRPGEFCWETLIAADLPGAKQFYESIFGWQAPDGPMPVFALDGQPDALVADYQQAQSMRATWLTYVVVDDLAAACDRTTALGGTIKRKELVVPNLGSYGLIVDPLDAPLGLFEPARR